jgi:hypothetical protein
VCGPSCSEKPRDEPSLSHNELNVKELMARITRKQGKKIMTSEREREKLIKNGHYFVG